MRFKSSSQLFAVSCLFLAALVGRHGLVSAQTRYPLSIDTYNYRKELVTQRFPKPPSRVLAVYQNSIETLLALGLEDRILAASGLDHEVRPELKARFEKINYLTEFAPSKETVLGMEPDFILSWYSYFGDKRLGDVDFWHARNINTYIMANSGAVAAQTLENEYTDLLNLGRIFNVEAKARAIVDEIKTEIARVEKSTRGQKPKRVLLIEFFTDKIQCYGSQRLGGDMLRRLGAEVLHPQGGPIGSEDIVALDPDAIFVVYMDRKDEKVGERKVDMVLQNPAWASLAAVRQKKIFSIKLGEMYCSGIRSIDGIRTFAKGLYPELY